MPRKMNFVLIIFAVSIFVIISTNGESEEYQKLSLQLHNKFRAKHGSPPMTFDCELYNVSVRCARYYLGIGTVDHSCPYRKGKGENLYQAFRPQTFTFSATEAVTLWYDEVNKYNYQRPGFALNTGHFTQVVWAASTRLGVGVAVNNKISVVAGIYSPPGNYEGQFPENVKPALSESPGKDDEAAESPLCPSLPNRGAAPNLLQLLPFVIAQVVPVLMKSRILD